MKLIGAATTEMEGPEVSICDIGRNTWTMAMAKYLPILSRGDTER